MNSSVINKVVIDIKQDWHVVSFSGGKDSTCMLLKMIEKGMQIDDVVFCDTGMEFDEVYAHIDKVEQTTGIKITRLKPRHDWSYFMFHRVKKYGKNKGKSGYGFPTHLARWCTRNLKTVPFDDYKRLHKDKNIIEYIGIAYDEQSRAKDKVYPLIEWKITEEDALQYCLDKGYDWGGLYDKFSRLSCWCCPFNSLEELKNIYFSFPEKWSKLKEWEKSTPNNYRKDYTIEELEDKFECEKKGLKYKRSCKK